MDFEPGTMVFDATTGRVGIVKTTWEPGQYTSPINGAPVNARVLEMEGGQSFVLRGDGTDEKRFAVMSEENRQFSLAMVDALNVLVLDLAQEAARRMSLDLFRKIMANALNDQAHALTRQS